MLEALDPEQRPRMVKLLGIDFDFSALTEVDDAVREDLPKEEQAEILQQLPPTERVALTRSLDYPEDSAGRRMQTEFVVVPPVWNVGQAID